MFFFQVTPTTDRAVTYDEESWKPSEEETIKDKKDLSRSNDVRQSKTKRVKNYLKKCKNVLGSSKSASLDVSSCDDNVSGCSSWYIDNQIVDNLNRCEINELEEIFEDAQVSINVTEGSSVYQVANIIEVRGPSTSASSASDSNSDKNKAVEESSQKEIKNAKGNDDVIDGSETISPVLTKSQDQDDGKVSEEVEHDVEIKEEELEDSIMVSTNSFQSYCLSIVFEIGE